MDPEDVAIGQRVRIIRDHNVGASGTVVNIESVVAGVTGETHFYNGCVR